MEADNSSNFKEIDVKELFYDKNPKLARWIPGFIYRYLRRVAHQDWINEMIRDYGHLKGYDFSVAMMKFFDLKIEIKGQENLPDEGRYIFAANHPWGGLDGHVIMVIVGDKYGEAKYKFLVNDLLMNLKNLHGVFIPVNKHGRQGSELAEKMDAAFESEEQILTFRSGLVSRKIRDRLWIWNGRKALSIKQNSISETLFQYTWKVEIRNSFIVYTDSGNLLVSKQTSRCFI